MQTATALPLPLISIITVTYNAGAFLERTIRSVQAQSYPHIEYLLIDGASKDQTMQIAEAHRASIHYLLSEPDEGLYDAMNKGLRAASGEYVLFLNAGDTFYAADTLARVFQHHQEETDIYYGEAQLIDAESLQAKGLRSELTPHRLPKTLCWQDLRLGMVVCHQAFIVRRKLAPLYDTRFRYSADVDWVITCLKKAKKVTYTESIIATFLEGGLSSQKRRQSLEERYQVLAKHFGFLPNLFNHLRIVWRGLAFVLKRRKSYF